MQSSGNRSRHSYPALWSAGRKPTLGLSTKASGRRYDDDECTTPMSDRTTSSCRTPLSGIDRLQRKLEKDALKWGPTDVPLCDRKETLEKKNDKLKKMITAMRRGLKNPSSEVDLEFMKCEKVADNDPTVAWELLRRSDWQQMNMEEWAVLRGTFLDLLKAKTEKEEENINLRGQVERILQAGMEQLGILERKTTKQVGQWREQMAKLLESKDYQIESLLKQEKETSRQISQLTAQLRTISASKAKQQGSPTSKYGTGIDTFGVSNTSRGATSGRISQKVGISAARDLSLSDARASEGPGNNARPRAKSQSPRRERDRSPRQQDLQSALKQHPQQHFSPQHRNGHVAPDQQFHSARQTQNTTTPGFASGTRRATDALLARHLALSPRRDSSRGPQAKPAEHRKNNIVAPAGGPLHPLTNAHLVNEVSGGMSARDSGQQIPEEQQQRQQQQQHEQQLQQQPIQQQRPQPHLLRARAMEPLLMSPPILQGRLIMDRLKVLTPESGMGSGMLTTVGRAEGSGPCPFPSQLRSPGMGLPQNSPLITPRQIPQIHVFNRLKPPPVLTSALSIGGGKSASSPQLWPKL
eukprot:GEMP01020213.1.p1 GENE.GEMP01020213.1~~GEMP01020213.1.p1  ORF type:complete len:589 (+),score=125.24 GEMP01020213.1:22-1767(+)